MNVLVLGSDCRAHAFVRALSESGYVSELFCMGSTFNPGIKRLCKLTVENLEITKDAMADVLLKLMSFIEENFIDVLVPTDNTHLTSGIIDVCDRAGVYCLCPRTAPAKLCLEKLYMRNKIPDEFNPIFRVFNKENYSRADLLNYLNSLNYTFVVKSLCSETKPEDTTHQRNIKFCGELGDELTTIDDCYKWVEYLLDNDNNVLIEERMYGLQFNVSAFVSRGHAKTMPTTINYNRVGADGKGPIVSSMGGISGNKIVNESVRTAAVTIINKIIPLLGEYEGLLSVKFINTRIGVRVVGVNCFLNETEAINNLELLNTDLGGIIYTMRNGEFSTMGSIKWKSMDLITTCITTFNTLDDGNNNDNENYMLTIPYIDYITYGNIEQVEGTYHNQLGGISCAITSNRKHNETFYELRQRHRSTIEQLNGAFYFKDDIGKFKGY